MPWDPDSSRSRPERQGDTSSMDSNPEADRPFDFASWSRDQELRQETKSAGERFAERATLVVCYGVLALVLIGMAGLAWLLIQWMFL